MRTDFIHLKMYEAFLYVDMSGYIFRCMKSVLRCIACFHTYVCSFMLIAFILQELTGNNRGRTGPRPDSNKVPYKQLFKW